MTSLHYVADIQLNFFHQTQERCWVYPKPAVSHWGVWGVGVGQVRFIKAARKAAQHRKWNQHLHTVYSYTSLNVTDITEYVTYLNIQINDQKWRLLLVWSHGELVCNALLSCVLIVLLWLKVWTLNFLAWTKSIKCSFRVWLYWWLKYIFLTQLFSSLFCWQTFIWCCRDVSHNTLSSISCIFHYCF